ncbi:hypothetical protein L1887_36065 [Cichorium endivia]|nr:hypothetical protein L1887_36065 [Cichorium endivia]
MELNTFIVHITSPSQVELNFIAQIPKARLSKVLVENPYLIAYRYALVLSYPIRDVPLITKSDAPKRSLNQKVVVGYSQLVEISKSKLPQGTLSKKNKKSNRKKKTKSTKKKKLVVDPKETEADREVHISEIEVHTLEAEISTSEVKFHIYEAKVHITEADVIAS